jgi:hypothetical protein
VRLLDDRVPRKAIVLLEDDTSVQGELIRRGYAKVKSRMLVDLPPGLVDQWMSLEQRAQAQQVGPLYQACDALFSTDNQLKPLEFTMETDWRQDGGRPVRRRNSDDDKVLQPPNPRDSKGCSDFSTYEDALRWYERYYPWYGDVAKLDRDKDGVPCPGLPHTKDPDRYRMKVPGKRT